MSENENMFSSTVYYDPVEFVDNQVIRINDIIHMRQDSSGRSTEIYFRNGHNTSVDKSIAELYDLFWPEDDEEETK